MKNSDRLHGGSSCTHRCTSTVAPANCYALHNACQGCVVGAAPPAQTSRCTGRDNHPQPGRMSCFVSKVARVSPLLSAITTAVGLPKPQSETLFPPHSPRHRSAERLWCALIPWILLFDFNFAISKGYLFCDPSRAMIQIIRGSVLGGGARGMKPGSTCLAPTRA